MAGDPGESEVVDVAQLADALDMSPNQHDDSSVVLEVLRGMADAELDLSERLSVRARQAFTFAAAFFAVLQAVAFTSFGATLVNDSERQTLVVLAVVAGAILLFCGGALVAADAPRKVRDPRPDDVLEILNKAQDKGEPVTLELSELFTTVVNVRREANRGRRKWVVRTQLLAVASAIAALAELVYALNARI